MRSIIVCCVALFAMVSAFAGESGVVKLPPPQTTGGMSLMQALQARHSSREFDPRVLESQQLSNLLWAAFGVNRADADMHAGCFPQTVAKGTESNSMPL